MKEINKKLRECFFHKIDAIKKVHHLNIDSDLDFDGPCLIYCNERDYKNANIKILFVGQEVNGSLTSWTTFAGTSPELTIMPVLLPVFWKPHGSYFNNSPNGYTHIRSSTPSPLLS